MNITILTDNPNSWIIPHVEELKQLLSNHKVKHIFSQNDIVGGDIMFILSCEKIIPQHQLNLHASNIVVHPSKLPEGKGWSPLAWQILEGKNEITISLFEASSTVDSGNIYLTDVIKLRGNELNDEIKYIQGTTTVKMILNHLKNVEKYSLSKVPSYKQEGKESFYPKFKKEHNELNINKTIKEQFNILRIVDNEKYPAFFKIDGQEYVLKIKKSNKSVLKLVPCTKEYWEYIRTLRNDEKVQKGFIETTQITPEMQEKYMNKYSECYRIALIEVHVGDSLSKIPVGFVGVIENDIRVCTHPDFQGNGYGKFMINECMKIWPNAFAKIKIDNKASLKLFKSCGFKLKYYHLTQD